MTRAMLFTVAVGLLASCRVDGLDIGGKQCPCGPAGSGYVCDPTRLVCVPGADASVVVDQPDLQGADLVDPNADLAGTHVLDVLVVGAPAGATVMAGGMPCSGGCSVPLPDGPVTILTTAPPRFYVSFEGACQTTDLSCAFALTGSAQVTVTFRETNLVFVTSSQTIIGNLGGLGAADARCQSLADAAQLPGTYRAWLSTAASSALSRLGTANGWVRRDGKPFAVSRAALVAGGVLYPPQITEAGIDVSSAVNTVVATGTYDTGTGTGLDAMGWAMTTGDGADGGVLHGGPLAWTWGKGLAATATARLYCFGVDLDAPLAIVKTAGRRMFVSTNVWSPAGGLASADARCKSDADAASLGGTYRALLATKGASAASRLSLNGPTWVRVDGLPLFKTAADLVSAGHTEATPSLLASGATVSFGIGIHVHAGAPSPTLAGTDADTCTSWSATTGWSLAGSPRSSRDWFSEPGAGGECTSSNFGVVYCFEE